MNRRILIVDDDRKTAELIRMYLERDGYQPLVAHDGRQALELARQRRPDLIVLDLMLPMVDGLDVCRILRAESRVPIIMLTARTTEDDKLLGLDLGADDYITKPFSPRELVARVRAVLRRAGQAQEKGPVAARFGELAVDFVSHTVRLRGAPLTCPRARPRLQPSGAPGARPGLRLRGTRAHDRRSHHELAQEDRARPGPASLYPDGLRRRVQVCRGRKCCIACASACC